MWEDIFDYHVDRKIIILCAITATIVITICSKSSFLYPLNDWVDANCFFTVGKSMMNGLVPYKDLLEQKGPLLYFIHGLAWLVSHDTFRGVYFIEIIAAFFFLLYAHKVMCFLGKRNAYLLIPLLAVITYAAPSFCQGDSAEELCLPLLMYGLYVGIQFIINKRITRFQTLMIGVTSGCILWIKFTMLGFYLGWIIIPAFIFIKENDIRSLLSLILYITFGVILVTLPFVIYFGINDALVDWVKVYFYDNIFAYSEITYGNKLITKLMIPMSNLVRGAMHFFTNHTICFLMCFYYALRSIVKSSLVSISILLMMIGTFISVYIGGVYWIYYPFAMSVFSLPGLVEVYTQLSEHIHFEKKEVKYYKMLLTLFIPFTTIFLTNNRYMIGTPKDTIPQYQFASLMKEKSNHKEFTLLNYGFLDGGFYLTTNTLPTCKAFCRLNSRLTDQYDLQDSYINDGKVDYVVTRNYQLKKPHYQCIATSSFYFESNICNYYYLYKLIDY